MNEPVPCCKHLAPGSEWSFQRMLSLDYYDGPTAAVAECQGCGAECELVMIDWASDYDTGESTRVFCLRPLPTGSLEAIVEVCPKRPPEDWLQRPFWSPRWEFPSAELREQAHQRICEIRAQAGDPEWVAAWISPKGPILASARLEPKDSLWIKEFLAASGSTLPPLPPDPPSTRDWFAFLGLKRWEPDGHNE